MFCIVFTVYALVLIANAIINFVLTGPVLKTIFFPKKKWKKWNRDKHLNFLQVSQFTTFFADRS